MLKTAPPRHHLTDSRTPSPDTELRATELAVMVPQHEVEVLPRQLLLVLETRLPEHGLHHLSQLGLGQAVVGDLDEGPGGGGTPVAEQPVTR